MVKDIENFSDLINNNFCHSCGSKLNSQETHAACVLEAIVSTAEDSNVLKREINRAIQRYKKQHVFNDRNNRNPVHLKDFQKALEEAIRTPKDDIDKPALDILSVGAKSKLLRMGDNSTDNHQENATQDSTSLYDNGQELDGSVDEDEGDSVQPMVEKVRVNHIEIGKVTYQFLGTAHTSPMLGPLYESMEEFDPELILLESSAGDAKASDVGEMVGHRASDKYISMNSSVKQKVLHGTPDDVLEGVNSMSKMTTHQAWTKTQLAFFEKRNRTEKMMSSDYHNRVVENRNDKFVLEILGYVDSIRAKRVTVILGKSHVPGVIKKIKGI